MTDLTVHLAGIQQFGDSAAKAAAQVATAGAYDLAANVAALTPALGLIGADFLAAFAQAQTNHAQSVAELATHFSSTAVAAYETAANYQGTDDATTAALNSAAQGTVTA
ncbi:type VII secretion target [Antrihabitans stalactiti]|uniref:ESX-1 secretion-associated protein n=1 Tax=Antrihabitans stalactiti TaxID=2584121 RepID=A0A848K4K7_9NOCA|nr:type VII secretion target [Antrihabitans stalactiti]NMN93623.1 ESX-1 secretion-associated protein [Antrihabitans stalactiti]